MSNVPLKDDNEKSRRGIYQRIPKGPAHVFKLGHVGHISHDIGNISRWYMENFNIRAVDIQADMKDESQVLIRCHLNFKMFSVLKETN